MRRLPALLSILLLAPLLLHATVYEIRVRGPIDTIMEEYVVGAIGQAGQQADASLILIALDTPGGYDTSMRAIIQAMLGARPPVAVYVSPRGARAASAGFFLLMAADIAIMAPGTSSGAAHPVSVTGSDIERTMRAKITNDAASYIRALARERGRNPDWAEKAVRQSLSYAAGECLQYGLIDFMANDTRHLLDQLQGRTVTRRDGGKLTWSDPRRDVVPLEMSPRQKFLRTITNPNIAIFLLLFGLIGLYIEFTHPGTLLPGILGAISLLLAFMAFQILPVNYIGLGLIILAVGLFIAEIKVQGFGVLGIGGAVALLLGSVILIDSHIPEMRPDMALLVTMAVLFTALFLFLTFKVGSAMRRRPDTGREALVGETGTARSEISARGGTVFVHGEWWNAVCDGVIPAGSRVRVEAVQDLVLKVTLK